MAAALGALFDTMMKHPLALQLRNLQDSSRTGGREEHHTDRFPGSIDERDRRTHRLPDARVDSN